MRQEAEKEKGGAKEESRGRQLEDIHEHALREVASLRSCVIACAAMRCAGGVVHQHSRSCYLLTLQCLNM